MKRDAALICDFVNTCDLEDAVEELGTPAAARRWFAERSLLARTARFDDADLARVVELREALRELLFANNDGDLDTRAATAVLDRAARRAKVALRFTSGGPMLDPQAGGVDHALGRILGAVAATMADGSWARLKACRSEICRWAFYDGAKNQSRVWCSMRVCGNREKARTFRKRHARAR